MNISNQALTFISLLMFSSSLIAEPVFVRLQDNLDDPRGYCFDLSGYAKKIGWDEPVQTHTCKHEIAHADQVVDSENLNGASGPLHFFEYKVCVKANTLKAGESLYIDHCDKSSEQTWMMSKTGKLSPTDKPELCLTISDKPIEAGTPPGFDQYWIRSLSLETCDNAIADRQQWQAQAPEKYNPGETALKP